MNDKIKHLSTLCFFLVLLSFLCSNVSFGVNQGKVFQMKEAYLKRSGTFSFVKPTSRTPYIILANASTEYLLGIWSQSIPSSISLEKQYNLLFSIWANKTSGNATLFGRIFLLRSGIESLILETLRSEQLNQSEILEMLWQSKTTEALNLIKNDILIFKLYLDVIVSGIFYFGYDCRDYPSYLTDPVETRYMTANTWSTLITPTSQIIEVGTQTSGTFPTDVQTSNDVYVVYTSAQSGAYQRVTVQYSAIQTGKIPSMRLLFELKASITGCSGYMRFWDYSDSSWSSSGEDGYKSFIPTTSDDNYYTWINSNCQRYRDTSGNWKVQWSVFKVTTTPFTVSVDYQYVHYTSWVLQTSNTASNLRSEPIGIYTKLGIRVWVHHQDGTETEITSGTPVAQIDIAEGEIDGAWLCIEKMLLPTDAVIIRLYKFASPTWLVLTYFSVNQPICFMTEDLSETPLQSVEWIIHYNIDYYVPVDDDVFFWGSGTYPSRITNFAYGVTGFQYYKYHSLSINNIISDFKRAEIKRYSYLTMNLNLEYLLKGFYNRFSTLTLELSNIMEKMSIFARFSILEIYVVLTTYMITPELSYLIYWLIFLTSLMGLIFILAWKKRE